MDTTDSDDKKSKGPWWHRHAFMIGTSAIIILAVITVAVKYSETFYGEETAGREALVPFGTCLAGVLLFIMGVSRRKRAKWSLREYIGDYCYRIAQAFAYLFIVLWVWSGVRSGVELTRVPPNIIGFLVGFFILRVERAMESLGEKFEEVLMSIFPQSVTYMTRQERRRQMLRDTYKLEEVTTKYEAMRPLIENEAVRQQMDTEITEAMEAAGMEDPEETNRKIAELSRHFDDARQAVGESIVPLEELLGHRRGDESDDRPGNME
jgi:hypothetical protein